MASTRDLLEGIQFTSQRDFWAIYLRSERAVLAIPVASRLIRLQRWVCMRC
jgi:hypothetical protein